MTEEGTKNEMGQIDESDLEDHHTEAYLNSDKIAEEEV